jgi:hypothetical protein
MCDSSGRIYSNLLHILYHIQFTSTCTECSSNEYTTLLYVELPTNIEKRCLDVKGFNTCALLSHTSLSVSYESIVIDFELCILS